MRKRLESVDNLYSKLLSISGYLAVGLLMLMAAAIFFLTVSRYVFHLSMPGLFEGAVYLLFVFPFLTAAYTLRKENHVSVDVITTNLSDRTRASVTVLTYLTALIFIVILIWQAWKWDLKLIDQGVLTVAVYPIPKSILISIMLFGSILLAIEIIRTIIQNIKIISRGTSSEKLMDSRWIYIIVFLVGLLGSTYLIAQDSPMIGITLLALVLLFSGMPVFLALGVFGSIGILFMLGAPSLIQIPVTAFKGLSSFPLTCLPLFIVGGLIMEKSGIAKDIFQFFEVWTGRFAFSSLLVTISVGMVFCAISGSTTATTAVIAGVALPILINRHYGKGLSCGTVAGATVGTLIPPSVGYVVYGVMTGESIGALFMAGLIPSVILFAQYFLYIILRSAISRRSMYENWEIPERVEEKNITWADRFQSLKTGIWGLLTPVIILGGIYMGIYTPTEAAAVLVVYAIFIALFLKKVKWATLMQAALTGALISTMILCIIFSAYIFSLVISQLRIAAGLVVYLESAAIGPYGILLIIFVILMIFGLFLDAASVKVITLPVFFPVATAAGINPLWFGIFYQFCNEIGLLTPPVGLNLFVIKGITGIPMSTIIKGTFPFVLMMVLTLVIIFLFPELVTWLPERLGGR